MKSEIQEMRKWVEGKIKETNGRKRVEKKEDTSRKGEEGSVKENR